MRLIFAISFHSMALISPFNQVQAQTAQYSEEYMQMERLVSMHAVEMLFPLILWTEEYERSIDTFAKNQREGEIIREIHRLTLETIFSNSMMRCIDNLKVTFRPQSPCEQDWFGTPAQRARRKKEDEELCKMEMLGRLQDCYFEGWIKMKYKGIK